MNEQKAHIEKIQNEYNQVSGRVEKGYQASIETLSDDLYAKDFHFLFELIQNAEDNHYENEVKPSLEIKLVECVLEGNNTTCLLINNNESGFNRENVDAICNTGNSTKSKVFDSIGEKGIGFKSVFKLTDCPYIFSNGYQFKLPKESPLGKGKLGYIVPYWVNERPTLENDTTQIFLPLNDKIPIEDVIEGLGKLSATTILFLKKIESLVIEIDLPDQHLSRMIEKTVDGNNVTLTVLENEDIFEEKYFIYNDTIVVPKDIKEEKREGVEKREIAVGIPLRINKPHTGELFAFLPVLQNTGLPFMIQADFLLTSNREGLHEDRKWNKWLLESISDLYCNAIQKFWESNEYTLDEKKDSIWSIPLESNSDLLKTTAQKIQQRLQKTPFVLTRDKEQLLPPNQVYFDRIEFDKLLSFGSLPKNLHEKNLIHESINKTKFKKQLEKVGIQKLNPQEAVDWFLSDSSWFPMNDPTFFKAVFSFLFKYREVVSLEELKLIPVNQQEALVYPNEYPIYFRLTEADLSTFNDLPNWLNERTQVTSLREDILEIIKDDLENENYEKWLSNKLHVSKFSIKHYLNNLINEIRRYEDGKLAIDASKLIEATNYIFAKDNSLFKSGVDIWLSLSDGSLKNIKEIRKLEYRIVVPENYNQTSGWQYIWVNSNERKHFKIISNEYSHDFISFLVQHNHIFTFPNFKITTHKYYDNKQLSDSEKEVFEKCYKLNTTNKLNYFEFKKINLTQIFYTNNYDNYFSEALIKKLILVLDNIKISPYLSNLEESKHNHGLLSKCNYYRYGNSSEYTDSEFADFLKNGSWVPTNKGFKTPKEVFLRKDSIVEIFGDSIPYLESEIELSENVINFLGIQKDINKEALYNYLISLRDNTISVDRKLITKLYSELWNRCRSSIGKLPYDDLQIIYIPEPEANWVNEYQCSWINEEEIDDLEFNYLGKYYPEELKDFFVHILGVREELETEHYAQKWLSLQGNDLLSPKKKKLVFKILQKIKEDVEAGEQSWVRDFISNVKIPTITNTFVEPRFVYFCSDVSIEELFSHTTVPFVLLPENESRSSWSPFFNVLNVKLFEDEDYLETTVVPEGEIKEAETKLLSNEFILSLAAVLNDEHYKKELKKAVESEKFNILQDIQEKTVNQLEVVYRFQDGQFEEEIVREDSFYFDWENNVLYKKASVEKLKLALALAQWMLSSTKLTKDLASHIEALLGTSNFDRIKDFDYHIPQEVQQLFEENVDTIEKIDTIKEDESVSREESNENDNSKISEISSDGNDKIAKPKVALDSNNEDTESKLEANQSENPKTPYQESSQKNSHNKINDFEQSNNRGVRSTSRSNSSVNTRTSLTSSQIPISGYKKPKTLKNRKSNSGLYQQKSPIEQLRTEKDKISNSIDSNQELTVIERKEEILVRLNELTQKSVEWLLLCMEMETLESSTNSKSRSTNLIFNKVEKDKNKDTVLLLSQSNTQIFRSLEEKENIELNLYLKNDTINRLSIQNLSVQKTFIKARLYSAKDLEDIEFDQILSASIVSKSVDFLSDLVLEQLKVSLVDQEKLVINCLPDSNKMSFVFGPPGTGKTTHIVNEILPVVTEKSGSKTLVLTPTNKAADVLTEKLIDSEQVIDFYRFGTTNSNLVEGHPCFVNKEIDINTSQQPVVITTIARFAYDFIENPETREKELLRLINWDSIIVDEASMVFLPLLLNVFMQQRGANFIISGDPFQIQPVLKTSYLRNQEITIYDLVQMTNFELEQTPIGQYPVTRLIKQYRSHPSIGKIFSSFCYNGLIHHVRKIDAEYTRAILKNKKWNPINLIEFPIHKGQSLYSPKNFESGSTYHVYSALLTVECVRSIIKHSEFKYEQKTIGVVCPYKAQADLIDKMLLAYNEVTDSVTLIVDTIHSFQGDECDIIFVVLNPPEFGNALTHLNNRNIINVAISRARDVLFILHPDSWENYDELKKLKQALPDDSIEKITSNVLEKLLFGKEEYISENSFITAHQQVNVYTQPEYGYEFKVSESSVDVIIKQLSN